MSNEEQRGFHIVVGFDGSEQSYLALEEALALAEVQEAVVHVLGVVDSGSKLEVAESRQNEIDQAAKELAGDIESAKYRLFIHTRIGTAAKEIIGLADETDADLVVVGTHGRKGVQRLLMGSVAEKVMRNAHCPVLVMRPTEHRSAAEHVEEALRPEPPCPQCVETRVETKGAQWWCEVHGSTHPHPRAMVGGNRTAGLDDWSRFNR